MMIQVGNFFFQHRNWAFIPLYSALFMPSPVLLAEPCPIWLLLAGLSITVFGQMIRGATIDLAYIKRGGINKKIYAVHLVTEGIFNHCRNPLYSGNMIMLIGLGILSNTLLYLGLVIPVFLFIFQAIVLAEENYLQDKFGHEFGAYCQRVNRWVPVVQGLKATFNRMKFNWRRWLVKELSSQYLWILGVTIILLFNYPELTDYREEKRNLSLVLTVSLLTAFYLGIRYLKKSGKLSA